MNQTDPTAADRQPAYDAVFAYIRQQPRDFLPTTVVDRNAMIWRAVNAALDAVVSPPTDRATLSGRLARRVAEDASAVRMDLYEDLANYARQTGNAGLQHSQIRDHLAEFLFEGLLRRLAVEAHGTGTQQPAPDETDASEADIDRMMAAGVPVQIVTRPPDTHGAGAQQPDTEVPWKSDGARIGRALIWSWTEAGKGEFGRGYRAAQEEARALLNGHRAPAPLAQQPAAEACDAQSVRHAPGTATLCPDCRAKGYAICTAAEQQAAAADGEETQARPECANCWREIENRGTPSMNGPGHDNWVHVPGGFQPCFPQKPNSPRAEPRP